MVDTDAIRRENGDASDLELVAAALLSATAVQA